MNKVTILSDGVIPGWKSYAEGTIVRVHGHPAIVGRVHDEKVCISLVNGTFWRDDHPAIAVAPGDTVMIVIPEEKKL